MRRVEHALNSRARVIVIEGMAGVGKTELLAACGREMRDGPFAGRVYWLQVGLGVPIPQVLSRLAAGIGQPIPQRDVSLEQAIEHVRLVLGKSDLGPGG